MDVTTHLAWDFAEFGRHIDCLTFGLLGLGVRKGDRVGVVMGNNSSYAMLQWACAQIGAILVTLNPAYRVHELLHALKLAGVKHLFVVPRIRSSAYVEMLLQVLPNLKSSKPGDIQCEELPELKNFVVVDNTGKYQEELNKLSVNSTIDWREILIWREDTKERSLQRRISASLKKDDIINLQYTSGTTGAPKAVSLTHFNLLNNAISIGRCMGLTHDDVAMFLRCFIALISLFRIFRGCKKAKVPSPTSLVIGNLAAWTHGASVIYPSEIFDPKATVDAVVSEQCTALHGVPTHFLGILAEMDKRQAAGEKVDTSSLRTGVAAGSPIPIEMMKKLIDRLNLVDLTIAYGMTETSPVSFQTTPADDMIKRVETVGKILPHVKAKIIDNVGDIVPVGVPGELCVAGYPLQFGYWNDEEYTQTVMKTDNNGILWMHTGDEGIMDEQGYLKIVGRIKDIIIRGGENLFPVQIENILLKHQGVKEAAVVSVPDNKYGEVVGAWIVRQPGKSASREEIRATVAQNMNPQNAPAWVWFSGEDGAQMELPKTASGKVQKHILRQWSKDLAKKGVGSVQRVVTNANQL
ncbi:hypothetical protein C0993_012331 [Termitomyces sp. T159_Od127]|nr:hypothetical protein C0993_012331 [Termitomyces sp. T159_Od127]